MKQSDINKLSIKEMDGKNIIKKINAEGEVVGYLVIDFEVFTMEEERANLRHDVVNRLNYVNRDKGFTFSAI